MKQLKRSYKMAETNITRPAPVHVDDVASQFKNCSEAFDWIKGILAAIKKEAGNNDPFSPQAIKTLAGAGMHIAEDLTGLSEFWREEVQNNGVIGD
jgi:hypothetical protein